MKSKLLAYIVLTCAIHGIASADTRITLKPEMVINESAFGDASALVDEQDKIGDPAAGKGAPPSKPYFGGWTAWHYPLHLVVDLGSAVPLTKLMIYNETGGAPIEIETGTPGNWKSRKVMLDGYKAWKTFPINDTSRYIRLTWFQPANIPEIAVYADSRPSPTQLDGPSLLLPKPVTMDQFIGTNAFIDDPIDLLAAVVGTVREYHNWSWDTEAPDGKRRFQPSGAAGGNAWYFDDYYQKLHSAGVTVCPAIQGGNPTLFPGLDNDAKPIKAGADSEDAASYLLHAQHLFQYAVRYAGVKVADRLIDLGPGQPHSSGLKTLHYFENSNEPDKTWKGRDGRFSPAELAAMCSADYDGDMRKMGKAVGIRNADPTAQLVLGGLSDMSLPYLRAMKFWADTHRNGDFPANVINLHHYSSDGTPEQPFKTTGISPEADHLREKLAEIVQWVHVNLPGREVWLSEFGYDTDLRSPFHAPAVGKWSGEETQAIWMVRSYFALAQAGVDRAMMCMFRDTKSTGGGVFETSGLVTEKGQWKPKPSYYYVATLKNRLKGLKYVETIKTNHPDVIACRFASDSGKGAIAVWRGTAYAEISNNVKIPVKVGAATRVDFKTGSTTGAESQIAVNGGKITLDVSEQPTIILYP